MSTVAGFHVPVIPFDDVVGNTGAADPGHIAGIDANVGTVCGLTVTVSVAVVAHCPAAGMNVYVPVVVLSTVAGDHVPLIPLVEDAGSTGAADPLQIAGIAVNIGVVCGLTVTVSVAVLAHCTAAGVNV